MGSYFRKIRQRLASKGNTGKYLKYAIGEIILVIIIQKYNQNLKTLTYRSLPKCRDWEGLGVGNTQN